MPKDAFTQGADALVTQHRRELSMADVLVVAHPNWWGKPLAIMAGWMDRALVAGVAYRLHAAEGRPTSLLRLRRLIVLNTTDTPPAREAADFGDPLDAIWRRCVGSYLGGAMIDRLVAGPMASSTINQRQSWLDRARELTKAFD